MRVYLILIAFLVIFFQPVKSQDFITPSVVTTLSSTLNETSGLINLDGEIWTHNDNGGETELYQINLNDGSIIRTVTVHEANNVDWEDIAADETYFYIGDFGNNDGSRTNLKIYRVSRLDIVSSNDVDAEKIHFSYSDQSSFEPNYHYTNFDCEALLCFQDHLYLFTKNWIDHQTKVYELPKTPGTYVAQYLSGFNVNCLITAAEIIPSTYTILLAGYNESGGTYTWLFTGFSGIDFFGGSSTKLIWTMLTQVEGICYAGNNMAYAGSEKYAGVVDPTLYSLDLSGYLTTIETPGTLQIRIIQNLNSLSITGESGIMLKGFLQILSLEGNVLVERVIRDENSIDVPMDFSAGIYLIVYKSETLSITKKIFIF